MRRPQTFIRSMTFLCAVALVVTSAAQAQLKPQEAFDQLVPADDLQVQLFAHEPDVIAPTAMDVDEQGRVWVAEGVNYRKAGGPRSKEPPYFLKPLRRTGDRIVVLEDTDGDGHADRSRTFYEGLDINSPQGFAVFGGKVWISQSPAISTIDILPDGTAGKKEVFLEGFGGIHGDHSVHSVYLGPDGKLYGCFGNTHTVLKLPDGRRIDNWQRGTGGGCVFRVNLDRTGFEVLGHNFRNGYECATDSFGNTFYSDNDDDEGNHYCRFLYVLEGGNFGHQPKPPKGKDWNLERPGVVPYLMRTGAGAPAGLCVYEGTLLGKRYRGMPLLAETGSGELLGFKLEVDGAGFHAEGVSAMGKRPTIAQLRETCSPDVLLRSEDSWYRPSDVCVAPDGSLLVADFYNRIAGGRKLDDELRGRIYRLIPKGHDGSYRPPQLNVDTDVALIKSLASPNLAARSAAVLRIQKLGDKALPALKGHADADSRILRARILFQLAALAPEGETIVRKALRDDDAEIRLAAVRALRRAGADMTNDLKQLAADDSARVRSEVLLALRDVDAAAAGGPLLKLAEQYDGSDRFYLEALLLALQGKDNIKTQIAQQLAGRWDRRVTSLLWALRPPAALERLTEVAGDENRPLDDRVVAAQTLGLFDDQPAGRALLALIQDTKTRPPLAAAALEGLAGKIEGPWKSLDESSEILAAAEHWAKDEQLQPSALRLARRLGTRPLVDWRLSPAFRAPEQGRLDQVFAPEQSADAALAPDWATAKVGGDGIINLAAQRSPSTNVVGYGLCVVHAAEPLETRLLVGSDDGIKIWHNGRLIHAHQITRGVGPRQDTVDVSFKQGENRLLVKIDQGTGGWGFIVEVEDPFGKLTEITREVAAPLEPAGDPLNPAQLPPDEKLLAANGDAARGREVYFRSRAGCAKCHRLGEAGGRLDGLGPALDGIGTKMGRDGLLEAIVRPSAKIAPQYVQWNVVTRQGKTFTGLVVEEGPDKLVLLDIDGRRSEIAKGDIELKRQGSLSIMPQSLVAHLSAQDLADLLAFLAEQKESEK